MQVATVDGESRMLEAGAGFARHLIDSNQLIGSTIALSGELGAGKTTFTRGFLNACGYTGSVKSPTYTLLEPYSTAVGELFHLDLYRLEDAGELEFIGFRDLLDGEATLLIEWPERVPELLQIASWKIQIDHIDEGSRRLEISAQELLTRD